MTGAHVNQKVGKVSFPARFLLAVLVLAVAAPAILVTGYVLMRYADAERMRLEEQLRDEARAIASAIDARFSSMIEAVQVLALTQEFDPEGLREFHARAERARGVLGRNIVLRELDGQQVVNPRVPWGIPLPRNARDDDRRAIETGRPQVSNVFESPISGEKIVSIVIPVMRDGKPRYLLNLAQNLSYFEDVLRAVHLPADHLALIMDRNDIVVARSREGEKFAGNKGVATAQEPEGAKVANNLENQLSLTGWATSEVSGWRTTASVRHEIIDAPRRQALLTIAATAASMILLGLALAFSVGARLSRSLQSLTRASAALGARAPVPEVSTPLSEANEVGRALRDAEQRLADNEARLERALVAARMYSFEYTDRDMTITRSASAGVVLGDDDPNIVRGSRELLRKRIHPLDRERFVRAVETRNAGTPEYSVEFRYIRPDGEVIWLQVNGVCEPDPSGDGVRVTGFARDITSRKTSEIRQSLLVRELHHRVKNNLATVLALANLSGRNASSVQDYQNKLRARIQSMARSHSLLNEDAFRSGILRTLLQDELEPYAQGDRERIRLDGPDVELPPEAALALGMAAHELATNAGKYGALSTEQGRLDVNWRVVEVDDGHDGRLLCIEWRESGGPAVKRPSRKGFGSRLLESVIGEQIKGRVELRYEPQGLVAIIEARLNGARAREDTFALES
ncbi:MAG: sensor histidine kinase [Beijerinckiaceae bacterium]